MLQNETAHTSSVYSAPYRCGLRNFTLLIFGKSFQGCWRIAFDIFLV
uniref:Uncharacterized protein n=1 Tax=Anguilla anguilla TaxID=7936 RepID=A0A0E9R8G2_ANGAN